MASRLQGLRARRWAEALRYAQALADYTAAEPLPWSDFNIARARALAAQYDLDYLVAEQSLDLPLEFSSGAIRIYRLR